MPYEVTTKEFSKLFAVSDRWIRSLAKDAGFENGKTGHGKWDLEICLPILYKYLSNKEESTEEKFDLRHQQARERKATADDKELELAIKRKQFLHIDDIRQYALGRDAALNQGIDSFPAQYVNKLSELLNDQLHIDVDQAIIYPLLQQISHDLRQKTADGLQAYIDSQTRDSHSISPSQD